jgi:hypothetical protein
MAERDASPEARQRRGRRMLVLIALVGLAPVIAATLVYLFFPRPAATNYGRLLPVEAAPEITGTRLDGTPFRLSELQGKWLLLMAAEGACGAPCRAELYATRQARTIQGREQDRVVRLWLVTDATAPSEDLLAQHPGVVVAQVDRGMVARLPAGDSAIYIVDPLGNLVLQYPQDPDIKGLAKDLKRLLAASSIG